MTSRLVLHCGAQHASIDQVRAVATPEGTDTHYPIAHDWLYDQTVQHLEKAGYKIGETEHALSKDGQRYFCLMTITPPGKIEAPGADASDMVLGLRNSHDKSFVAGIAAGNVAFVCDNLSFSACRTLARKHTKNIVADVPGRLDQIIGQLVGLRNQHLNREELLRQIDIPNQEAADHLLMDLFRAGVIPSSKIAKIVAEYENPRHDEYLSGCLWTMYNAITEIRKGVNVFNTPRMGEAMAGVMLGRAEAWAKEADALELLEKVKVAEDTSQHHVVINEDEPEQSLEEIGGAVLEEMLA